MAYVVFSVLLNSWPNSQIPECTCSISHNAPFRTEMSTFLFWMEHCGIWNRCILGFEKLVCCRRFETPWHLLRHYNEWRVHHHVNQVLFTRNVHEVMRFSKHSCVHSVPMNIWIGVIGPKKYSIDRKNLHQCILVMYTGAGSYVMHSSYVNIFSTQKRSGSFLSGKL